ncbi:glucuronyl hydrolase [Vallitalea longa]|uniref:Glucuronyl hydrolase n=1 Tax=Vallitalea longa TaxID=2936439 RepID=A0A9W5YDF0_9FIRM|nr:glycoside hydrolase family 88 protein [Vallitalea longa]GKX31019.1 glucuronyl hydrolase [Vallitalea longa]
MNLYKKLDRALDLARKQLTQQVNSWDKLEKTNNKTLFPFVTRNGKWIWDDKWSNGFLPGQLWLLYSIDMNEFWHEYADMFTRAIEYYKNKGDFQDIGYLFIFSYINGYKETGEPYYRQVALEVANNLFESLTPQGYLKCSWLKNGECYQGIDEFMNIGIWLWAYKETNDNRYKSTVEKCINKMIDTMISDDGKTCEYVKFNSNGEVVEIYNKNAESNNSVWSRGHSWAIYGLVQAFLYTDNRSYLEIIDRLTSFYVDNTGKDGVPYWDLLITDELEIKDSSAASIAASAFVQLSIGLKEINEKQKYYNLASRLLNILISEKYMTFGQENHEGILIHASTPKKVTFTQGESQVWGDYFLLEAITSMRRMNYGN